ncbi:MAG: class I SAM-dependent methyltransferase [Acidobacteriia bacterium]|nr:class I SAM-dependent methyltransferase [Terriglobia bacterium]
MQDHEPSRTAISVALRRAAHQVLDSPKIFDDPLALPILGRYAARMEKMAAEDPQAMRSLRLFLAVRSRFAEDELAAAVARGTRQYVLLGAGLDTFAYRNPHPGLRVFEVDHPATQHWKRSQIEAAAITVPEKVVYVPVDFERQPLPEALQSAGLDTAQSAFFAWLGVVPYLTIEAFESTLGFIASMPAGSGVVFDYGADPAKLSDVERAARNALAGRVAALGEPFRLFFDLDDLHSRLVRLGFPQIEDLGADEINARYNLSLTGRGGRLISARL